MTDKTDSELLKSLTKIYGDNEVAKDMIFGLRRILDEAKVGNTKSEEILKSLSTIEEQGMNNVETFIDIMKTLQDNNVDIKELVKKLNFEQIMKVVFKDTVLKVREEREIRKVELTKEVKIEKPIWYKAVNPLVDIVSPIGETLMDLVNKIFRVKIVNTDDPTKPIAVRLSDGERFYNAITTAIQGGWSTYGGGGAISFSNSSSQVKEALIDGDRHVQVDLVEDKQVTTPYKLISAGSTNATVVKATAGKLYGWSLGNVNGNECYVKFYDKATAPDNADIPVLVEIVPGNTAGSGNNLSMPKGINFTAGISFRIVTGVADNDNTGVSASEVIVNLMYI